MNDFNLTSIWLVDSVEMQPSIHISNWSIRAVIYKSSESVTHHIVGYSEDTYEGRVSSAIIDFDSEKRTLTTRSGRKYILVGKPGFDGDGEHVWRSWKYGNQAHSEVDVTDEYAEKLN